MNFKINPLKIILYFESAVTDENLITASGIVPLEFTMQVLKVLDVFKSETLQAWFNVYKIQEPKYFFELMDSMVSSSIK